MDDRTNREATTFSRNRTARNVVDLHIASDNGASGWLIDGEDDDGESQDDKKVRSLSDTSVCLQSQGKTVRADDIIRRVGKS